MDEPRTVINLEETIGKWVGRRKAPKDPLRLIDSNIERSRSYHEAFPSTLLPRGVYRFRSHAEANAWMFQKKTSR